MTAGYSVADMTDAVEGSIAALARRRWWIAGHSMGAKVAMALARRAQHGASALEGLAGMILVAGSPPGPEPMPEEKRDEMLGWFTGDPATNRAQADHYIQGLVTQPLDGDVHAQAVMETLRANPSAWRAWLQSGSREDWSEKVGRLRVPTLLIAGEDDEDLGAVAQRDMAERHLEDWRLATLPGAHLLPLECPDQLAGLVAGFVDATKSDYRRFIASNRVSENTRALLLERLVPDDPAYEPRVIPGEQLETLRALLARVIPQTPPGVDLAARLDGQLAMGNGDGWRFATLPPDPEAYRAALRTLDAAAGSRFAALAPGQQDELLKSVANGCLAVDAADVLTASQMKQWFEDVRGEAVRLYVAHPGTLARMGYSGIGYSGDGEPKPGFRQIGPGEREPWEPEPDPEPDPERGVRGTVL
jgi:surfactin synthase thioesterase subunit